jgi:hypothetical protein
MLVTVADGLGNGLGVTQLPISAVASRTQTARQRQCRAESGWRARERQSQTTFTFDVFTVILGNHASTSNDNVFG